MRLPYPIYHGTSTAYLPLIKEHGLGARCPHHLFDTWEAFWHLDDYITQTTGEMRSLGNEMAGISEMVRQKIKRGANRYNYKGVYLSSSKDVALSYASRDGNMGELAGFVHRMLTEAKLSGYDERQKPFRIYEEFRLAHKPLIIEIPDVSLNDVLFESGQSLPADFFESQRRIMSVCNAVPREDFLLSRIFIWGELRQIPYD